MSATEVRLPESKTVQTASGSRTIPHHSQKAKRFYPAQDEKQPKKVRKTIRPTKVRASLQPGAILIILAGRFRGKRVILLKHLEQGVLLVTGPFKVNGVPLRRVNARYVIATSQKVDVSKVDSSVVEKVGQAGYFTAGKEKKGKGEEAFFKQGEKPEKKQVAGARAEDQKAVDKALISGIKSTPHLIDYLRTSFSLRNGDKPHEMQW